MTSRQRLSFRGSSAADRKGARVDGVLSVLDQLLHRLDAIQLAAIVIAITVLIATLLAAILVMTVFALRHLSALRNLERDGYISEYKALEAILRQTTACTTQVEQLKRDLAAYAASR